MSKFRDHRYTMAKMSEKPLALKPVRGEMATSIAISMVSSHA